MSSMPTPHIEYDLLAPLLIVFGTAVTGVLFEAFVGRRARYLMQVLLALSGLAAAFVAIVAVGREVPAAGRIAVLGAVAVDRPVLVLQGTMVLVGIMAVIFIAERNVGATVGDGPGAAAAPVLTGDRGLDSFTPQASAVPGSVTELDAARTGVTQTEVFPLTVLAVGGKIGRATCRETQQ